MRALAIGAAARIRNGCAPTNMWGRQMTVIGVETVLSYAATVSPLTEGGNVRFTEWFAPGLDCVSVRSTTETALVDGVFRPASERRVGNDPRFRVTFRSVIQRFDRVRRVDDFTDLFGKIKKTESPAASFSARHRPQPGASGIFHEMPPVLVQPFPRSQRGRSA
jgi:hypothetical protein